MGGRVFGTVPLTSQQWGVCLGFGAGGLLVGAVLRALPTGAPAAAHSAAADGDAQPARGQLRR